MIHEPGLCKCGHDTLEEAADGPACLCQCEKCTERRKGVLYLWRLRKIEKRLEAAGISADDLATLLWFKREDEFKKQIDKMVHEAIEYELQNMRVILRRDL